MNPLHLACNLETFHFPLSSQFGQRQKSKNVCFAQRDLATKKFGAQVKNGTVWSCKNKIEL